MSDESWPHVGPGLTPHDPLSDGVPSRGERSGSFTGPGLSRSKEPTRNHRLYLQWRKAADMATFGTQTTVTVQPQVWNAQIAKIRKKLLERFEDSSAEEIDARLLSAFQKFLSDVKSKRVSVEGKDTWFVFMARHHRYTTPSVAKVEKQPDGSWRDRMRKM